MITIEFGAAENQTLDKNSIFIKLYGKDFQENLSKIKSFWNRTYIKKTTEWEVPFSCFDEIRQLYQGVEIKYLNEPPKAKFVEHDEILNGLDFNGYNLYDYQIDGVRYGLNHHNFLLLDEQGCVSGDSVVQIKADSMKATRRVTLSNLYKLFTTKYYKNIYIKTLVNGRFGYMPIKSVVDTGMKPTITINYDEGSLTCTEDHLVYTNDGWKCAGDLMVNDKLCTNGIVTCRICGSDKNVITNPYAKFNGYCRKCMYKSRNGTKYKDAEIVRQINSEGYVVLKGKGTRNFPSYKRRGGNGVLEHNHIMEMYLGRCLDTSYEVVHHINGIKTDNRLENLQLMTKWEHAKLHSTERKDNYTSNLVQYNGNLTHYQKNNCTIWLAPKLSNIISINRELKQTHVYDVVIDDDKIHNFVCNGVVVHNCGKTLQAITLARYKKQHMGLKHCLIICGVNSLKWNWQREVEKFCKDEKAIVLGTTLNKKGKVKNLTIEETKKQIQSCPEEFFWIINIEKMRLTTADKKTKTGIADYFNEQIKLGNLGMVFIDEIHRSKSMVSAQSKGIMHLDPSISKVGMTGTLLVNNPYDLYCPMSFIGLINKSIRAFEYRYVIKDDWNQPIGYQNMDELHNILFKSSIRRTKDLLTLPPKVYKQEWLEFSDDEQRVFEAVMGVGNINLLDKINPPQDMMAVITRMRQCTVASYLISSKTTKSVKLDRLNDILEEAKLNNQKVLVFCPFTEALKYGLEYCSEYKPKLVCGGMGEGVQQTVDEHENTEGFSVLFAQEATLGVGYTLKNTEIVVFLSPPWNRATYDQCCDRCHRIGQKKTVQIIDLLIKDSYDELIYKKLHGKGAMSDILIDGENTPELRQMIENMGVKFSDKEMSYQPRSTLLDGILGQM